MNLASSAGLASFLLYFSVSSADGLLDAFLYLIRSHSMVLMSSV